MGGVIHRLRHRTQSRSVGQPENLCLGGDQRSDAREKKSLGSPQRERRSSRFGTAEAAAISRRNLRMALRPPNENADSMSLFAPAATSVDRAATATGVVPYLPARMICIWVRPPRQHEGLSLLLLRQQGGCRHSTRSRAPFRRACPLSYKTIPLESTGHRRP
jgi:hypothetical protein